MPAPGKIKLIKFPPPGQEKTSNARGMPGGGGCLSFYLTDTLQVKNSSKQENIVLQLTFNPRLTLASFRTTGPRTVKYPVLEKFWKSQLKVIKLNLRQTARRINIVIWE